jgi:hypothetical protein
MSFDDQDAFLNILHLHFVLVRDCLVRQAVFQHNVEFDLSTDQVQVQILHGQGGTRTRLHDVGSNYLAS